MKTYTVYHNSKLVGKMTTTHPEEEDYYPQLEAIEEKVGKGNQLDVFDEKSEWVCTHITFPATA